MRFFPSWYTKIVAGMATSLWLLITFWLWFPYEPITINSITIKNIGEIYAGEDMYYDSDYTKVKTYPVVKVTRQLIDGSVIVLAPSQGSLLPIGDRIVRVKVQIPGYVTEGKYILHLQAEYRVNPLRTVSVSATSDEFLIKRRPGNG